MGINSNEARRSQLLKGALDLCLLATIGRGPTYGYEMTRRLAASGLDAVAEGSIYPVLGRLERDGLVEAFRQESNGGPPRKYYRLSASGRAALTLWTAEWNTTRDAIDAVLTAPQETHGQPEKEATA